MRTPKEEFKEELENQYSILIKANAKEQRKRTIIIITILSLTLIATTISTVFAIKAYSSTKIITKEKTSASKKYYQTLSTTYNDSSKLEISNIYTGFTLVTPKIITITNEGDTKITYDVKIKNINTSLLSTNSLVYTITKDNQTSSSKELPLSDSNILSEIEISPKETVTYVINVTYNGVIDNNTNYYNANIVVEQNNKKTNLLD